ncbi:SGNH/GDSL hydrolase family protein [Nocardioides aurantiacus]|uniref:GDSL-like lipase/acylhydrolase family protein n=1 Tax=Nocardioides aurantiacus TaxID=86796 RepID=A0A3N2CQY9_9ACTN|nr:SGNH/GDSL hydrolase family protein [Nocardioides aurantiacus]ROR89942.1 GDSL-like lipase/acylhydrolase family protein [Nocardioides aurantiacus]
MRLLPLLPPRPRATALAGGLAAALLLSGCGAGTGTPEPAPSAAPSAAAPSEAPGGTSYVALGDSYTSAPFVPQTDVAGGCFRSDDNYPAQVADALGADLTDVSCAGADTGDVRRPQLDGVPPQADALGPDADLVTVSMGGNDGGVFSTLVGQCGRPGVAATDCSRPISAATEARLRQRLGRTATDLARVLRLAARRAPDARVLAVGYPTIVAAGEGCEALPLSAASQAAAARLNTGLNDAVRTAARRAGATYVDVAAATEGHDICAEDPWINGATTDQQRALAFHPFAAEQRAVAEAVVAAVER